MATWAIVAYGNIILLVLFLQNEAIVSLGCNGAWFECPVEESGLSVEPLIYSLSRR